jgi:hypothetical protein
LTLSAGGSREIVRRVSGGRRAVAIAAGCIAALLVAAVPAQAGPFPDFPPIPRGAKVSTDGTLTVGQQETLYATHVPRKPKMRLNAAISPPPTASDCFDFSVDAYCLPQPLFRVPGTPRLHRSHKGRGSLTFVMPPAYEYINFADPIQSHPVTLVNGQTVHVDLEGTWRKGNTTWTAPIADSIAVVEVRPPPPSS